MRMNTVDSTLWQPPDIKDILTPYYNFDRFNALAPTDHYGLIKVGGKLNTDWVLEAYCKGIFPWYEELPIKWYSPPQRFILRPSDFKVSRSFKKFLNKHPYRIVIDSNFIQVIRSCAHIQRNYFSEKKVKTWITPAIIKTYKALHLIGIAHSVEIWKDDNLVGGLYGLSLGKIFFGESMFYTERDCSKLALYTLCQYLAEKDFFAIDCQVYSEHLESLGAVMIFKKNFLELLLLSHRNKTLIGRWDIND